MGLLCHRRINRHNIKTVRLYNSAQYSFPVEKIVLCNFVLKGRIQIWLSKSELYQYEINGTDKK